MELRSVEAHALTEGPTQQITTLLEASFSDTFAGRTFYKQEPHRRVLALDGDRLVGQVGVDARIINVGGHILRIVGVVDLCVSPSYRGTGVGSVLLEAVEQQAVSRDFVVLMADRDDLYVRHGYRRLAPALTRWLAIEDLRSWGVIERDLGGCFMLKPMSTRDWPDGKIDLLGYLF